MRKKKKDPWGGHPDSFQGLCRAKVWKILEEARVGGWGRNRIAVALDRARRELGAVSKKDRWSWDRAIRCVVPTRRKCTKRERTVLPDFAQGELFDRLPKRLVSDSFGEREIF